MRRFLLAFVSLAVLAAACSGNDDTLTVYSGRTEALIGPLLDRFTAETGIDVEVRYADSPDLAATLLEEQGNSPADVFVAQDPASLGAVALAGLFDPLPPALAARVPERFSDPAGRWVGFSGRSRVVVYDTRDVDAADLPMDVAGFTDPGWRGRLAVAPANGSFLSFVAAMILLDGEEATRAWLEQIAANEPAIHPRNSVIVAAVDAGEIDAGLVNHYYLLRLRAERGETTAANHFLAGGPGALVMPSGVGILATAGDSAAAEALVEFLLSDESQAYFATETFEYPLVAGVPPHPALPPLEDLRPPRVDLSQLAETLDRATDLVAEAGLL
jgi:iron(III) transport system substrate-binding protein